ncbi:hypothetical protein GOV10_03345 [Candidatus Woesearchaeota archaeon]|nr:hypothetical protein [Candidatus Woesearchaeota archaeon]
MVTLRECCTDHDGKPKKKYTLREDAKDAARHLEIEHGVIAEVYECDAGDGWHLTTHYVQQEPRVLRHNQPEPKKRKVRKTTIGKALGKDFFEQLKESLKNDENNQR